MTRFTPKFSKIRNWDLRLLVVAVILLSAVLLSAHLKREWVDYLGSWHARLETYADSRARAVEAWVGERKADTQVLSASTIMTEICAHGVCPKGMDLLAVQQELEHWARYYTLSGAYLFTPLGDLLLSSEAGIALTERSSVVARRTAREQRPLMDDIRSAEDGTQRIGFFAPVYARSGASDGSERGPVIGVVALYLDPRNTLYPVVNDVLFSDSEAHPYLVSRCDGVVRVLTPVPGHDAFQPAADFTSDRSVEAIALDSAPASGWFVDYAGSDVLGAVRRIPGTEWGLVVTAAREKVLFAWRSHLWWSVSLTVVSLTCLGLAVLAAWRSWSERKHKSLMEKVASRERRLDALTAGTEDLVFIKDLDQHYLLVNPAMQKVLGATAGEALGRREQDFLPSGVAEKLVEHDRQVIESGILYQGEEILPVAGRDHTFLSVRLPIRDEQGRIEAVAGILRDITARKEDERAMGEEVQQRRKAERRVRRLHGATARVTGDALFSAVVQALADELGPRWVFLNQIDATGTVHVLAAVEDGALQGFDPFPLRGTPCEETVNAKQIVYIPNNLADRLRVDSYLRRRDVVSYAGVPVLSSRGEVLGVLCMFDDVTIPLGTSERDLLELYAQRIAGELERLHAEQTIDRTRRSLETLVQNLPGAAYRCDGNPKRRTRYISGGVEMVTGYRREVFLSEEAMTLQDLIVPEDRARVWREISYAMKDERPYEVGYRIHAADGSVRWMNDLGRAVVEDEGEQVLEGVIFDQTERYSLEAQVAHGQRMEALGRLAGGVAHDFNNLLTAISGYAEMLLRKPAITEQVEKPVQGILHTTDRAAELTRQLLAFSKSEVAEPKIVSLRESVEGALGILERVIGDDVEFKVELADNDGQIKADPSRLEQVLVNLVVNARDAMPQGGLITVKTYVVDGSVVPASSQGVAVADSYEVIEVADTGVGIPEEVRIRIFEPFFTTKAERGGTGLGLSTVYGIVHQAGGVIEVDSTPGEGTRVRVFWPTMEPREGKDEHSFASSSLVVPVPEIGSGGVPARVILVDDDETVAELAAEFLTGQQFEVYCYPSGTAMVEDLDTLPRPDLLITDIMMQGMSGVDLAEVVQRHWPNLPVIFMSGYVGSSIPRGAVFLPKPFHLIDLEKRVRQVLSVPR